MQSSIAQLNHTHWCVAKYPQTVAYLEGHANQPAPNGHSSYIVGLAQFTHIPL